MTVKAVKGLTMLYMLFLSVALLLGLMLSRRKRYSIPSWKIVIIMALVVGLGIASTKILYFIENGEWGGMSFFGAVFFLPLLMAPISILMKIPVKKMMDFIAPPGLLMFAIMKANCFFSGCCGGRVIRITSESNGFIFPIQIVEAITTVVLVGLLLILEYKKEVQGRLYPISLVAYGGLRFCLHFLRKVGEPFFLGLQAGTFWAILSVVIGMTWILVVQYKKTDKQYQEFISQQQK